MYWCVSVCFHHECNPRRPGLHWVIRVVGFPGSITFTHVTVEPQRLKTNISRVDETPLKPFAPSPPGMSLLVGLWISSPPQPHIFPTVSLPIHHFSSPRELQTAVATWTGQCCSLWNQREYSMCRKGQATTRAHTHTHAQSLLNKWHCITSDRVPLWLPRGWNYV